MGRDFNALKISPAVATSLILHLSSRGPSLTQKFLYRFPVRRFRDRLGQSIVVLDKNENRPMRIDTIGEISGVADSQDE